MNTVKCCPMNITLIYSNEIKVIDKCNKFTTHSKYTFVIPE